MPRTVDPSRNWTAPPGVPEVEDITVAVNITDAFKFAFDVDEVNAVVLAACVRVSIPFFTVTA
jgi:hypothetical protein